MSEPIQAVSPRQAQVTELVSNELNLLSRFDRGVWFLFGAGLPTAVATTIAAAGVKASVPTLVIVSATTMAATATTLLLMLTRDSRRRRRALNTRATNALTWLESFTNADTANDMLASPYLKGRLVANIEAWRWLLMFVTPEVLRAAMDKTIEQRTFSFGSHLYHQATNQFDRSIIYYDRADDLEYTIKALMAVGDLSAHGYRLLCTGHNYSIWHDELDKLRRAQVSKALSGITVSA
jgi:hypothetical protein